ncbi:MAG: acyltransferase family protein [Erysipelotrichaceae bacterium]|nr:acyltransferase family protein [Erysipelotrichaceae bacterium]
MTINLLSKHRNSLMAIAMIWVAIRHSNFPMIINKAVNFVLVHCGYAGADAFVFLSGFGIYYACKKEPKYWDFIKRRLIRILPYSVAVCLLLFAIGSISLKDVFVNGFGLAIWFRIDWVYWYVSFILLMYLLTPFYMKLFKKNPYLVTVLGIGLVSLLCCFLSSRNVYIFFRTNLYLLGILFAHINDKKPETKMWWTLIPMVFGFVLQYYLIHYVGNNTLYTPPFLLAIPGVMCLSAWIIDKLKFVQKPLAWLSKYSFLFYLIHEEIVSLLYLNYAVLYRPGIYFDWLINIVAIVIALLISILIKKVIDYSIKIIMRT